MKITDIERIWLDVPFHDAPQRNMSRNCHGWHICEILRVTADNGMVGVGETLPHYTWGKVSDKAIERAKGGNPFELMWDDSLGAGLQMAMFDLAGQAAEVPAWRLMGKAVRDWCPVSWWTIDMPADDIETEAVRAVEAGYTCYKQKARPWFDPYEQVKRTAAVVPKNFKLDLDFNDMLVNAGNAIPLLLELDKTSNVAIYESPIHQSDVEGNRKIRQAVRCPIALHYGVPPIHTAVMQQACDGFVVSGGASRIMQQNALLEGFNMPFWLQLVGSGITASMALHLGAVCRQAQWPAITCMNMYEHQLLAEPIPVRSGYAPVPQKPGLGITLDEDAVNRYRVDKPDKPNARALYAFVRPSGQRTWYCREMGQGGFWNDFQAGNQPVDERDVRLETWEDDGTPEWTDLFDRVQDGPVREG